MSKGQLQRGVSIMGVGYTPMGDVLTSPEIKDFSERELISWACLEAMENADIEAKDIDACYLGMSGPNFDAKLKSGGPFFMDWIGMRNKPVLFHDEGCASSGFGLNEAVLAVASGRYDCAISTAVNINLSIPRYAYPPHIRDRQDMDDMWGAIWTGVDAAYERPGYGGAGPVEAVLRQYAINYGLSRDDIDEVFINYLTAKRREALLNTKALMATETYEEEAKRFGFDSVKAFLTSNKHNPSMGGLVRTRYIGKVVDAASAVIVCTTEMARKYAQQPIEVAGISTVSTHDRVTCEIPSIPDKILFKEIYEMADITDPYHQVDYMGIHDCPATMILPVSETSGYIKPGEAWKFMRDGRLNFDQDKPINTTGGRTQSGHPRSPAYVIEIAEAVSQMRGDNGARQMVKRPKTSVVWGAGSGSSLVACVLKTL